MDGFIPERIRAALSALAGGADFAAAATGLLGELGYRSDRILPGQSGDAGALVRQFPAANPDTQSERDFLREARSVHILFQLTDAEIDAVAQQSLFRTDGLDAGGFDKGNAQSFLFAAVALRGDAYPRSRYAAFTRELNKRFQNPMVVLFRAGAGASGAGRVTLAFVHRRPNRNDPARDVLGNVALIREIDPASPHRAHRDILAELALPARLEWMDDHGAARNFDGLLDAWLAALDTEELNRRFYRDLFAWFERALGAARFPTDEAVTLAPEEHIIRLITRMLFVWFLKEKGLVAGGLFAEHRAAQLLKDYDRAGGDNYYRAVLQNLFFATLNTAIGQRGFSSAQQSTHRVFSRYRYARQIADTDGLAGLLARTPFVNGGLFDCLDSERATRDGGYRVDCFSDVHYRKLSIPNRLFFGDDGSPGLIDLFDRYKFTVEENTPAELEVALDPELLGKVFENLLAAVNPETSLAARKETGSYYTPRPVVDYMVDEALAGALAAPDGATADGATAERIRRLLDYGDAFADAGTMFTPPERERIIRAIAGLKALDPAVGSGAFPMGILHKLTLALRRLDPDNRLWENIQREQAARRAAAAFGTDDQAARDAELDEISAVFERYRDSDYGRKLYLIQNCIYGVDIQPIAVQIAKLRFFISLAIEQEPNNDAADNYGIRPLPNLETRFVAADTLLALARPAQRTLGQTAAVTDLERQIAANRERHFHAVTRQAKLDCRRRDDELRRQLAQELQADGFPAASAGQIAAWEPFDQNAGAADWFDAGYMFGVPNGFDVVIANPPYVRQEGIAPKAYKDALLKAYPDAAVGRSDLYCYFYARGLQLLKEGGMHLFVCSNSWLDVGYGAKLQEYLLDNATVDAIYESAVERQFSTAAINTIISVVRKGAPDDGHATRFVRLLEEFEPAMRPGGKKRVISKTVAELRAAATSGRHFVGDKWGGKYLRAPAIYHHILDKCSDKLVRLGDIATVRASIKTGANPFFYLTREVIAEWWIEPEFLRPVMTRQEESSRLAVNPATLPYQLFLCHSDKSELDGTRALAYIEWGEKQGYHQRRSTRSRARWYDLGRNLEAKLAFGCRVDTTSRTMLAVDGLYFDKAFYKVDSQSVPLVQLCASLNATMTQLMINTEGRANLGGGLLEIEVYETQNLRVVNPQLLPELDAAVFNATDWDVLTPSAARRRIDAAVYEALGLTADERDAVHAGVVELVGNRKRRAGSVRRTD